MGTARKTRRQPDVLDLITEQHELVDRLMEQLEEGDLEGAEKLAVFRQLADNLAAHAAMEEKLFYPSVMGDQTEDQLLESTEEHLSVKRLLADMLDMDVEDERFDAKLSVLKEQVSHHAHEEEEGKLFPKVRRMFSADELEALGAECLAMFEQMMTMNPRMLVPEQTAEAAELPMM